MILEPQFDFGVDYDGTLTSAGAAPIGQRNPGVLVNVTPLRLMLGRGFQVAVMTCNTPSYVADVLLGEGIPSLTDPAMQYKIPPQWLGRRVLVTNRKILARRYVDDRGLNWKFGDDPELIFKGM